MLLLNHKGHWFLTAANDLLQACGSRLSLDLVVLMGPDVVSRHRKVYKATEWTIMGHILRQCSQSISILLTDDSGAARFQALKLHDCTPAPLRVLVLKSLRSDHLTVELLHAALLGRVVCSGAVVSLSETTHISVVSVETSTGASSGIAFGVVDAGTSVKVNDSTESINNIQVPTAGTSPACIGIEEQVQRLEQSIFSRAAPGPSADDDALKHEWHWMLLWGRHGCGVSSAVRILGDSTTIVRASTLLSAGNLATIRSQRPILVLMDDAESMLPPDDPMTCKLRKGSINSGIQRAEQQCTTSTKPVFVVCAISRSPPNETYQQLFDDIVGFPVPDASTRLRILTKRFSETADALSASTVGMSRSALLFSSLPTLEKKRGMKGGLQWSQIGGLANVKSMLHNTILRPRTNQAVYQRFGLVPPKGVLLYGPPGCAKTSLVKALCNDQHLSFIYLDGAELISAYIGESERTLRETFVRASEKAPCVVFFDEVEIIGGSRSTSSDNSRLLSTLLMELDGFSPTADVCFVGATNMPHMLDSALLRPGRFDQLVYVPLPTCDERQELFSMFLCNAQNVDCAMLAESTEHYSGADIASICRSAVGELIDVGDASASALTTDSILSVIHKHPFVSYDARAIEAFHRHAASVGGR